MFRKFDCDIVFIKYNNIHTIFKFTRKIILVLEQNNLLLYTISTK